MALNAVSNVSPAGGHKRPYWWSVLVTLVGYASYAISKGALLVCAVPLLLLASFSAKKRAVLHWMTHRYLGFFTRAWLPGLGVYRIEEINGLDSALAITPAIYVANHRSFMDGLLLLGLLPRTGVLIKARDTRQFTYGFLERHLDLIGIDGNSLTGLGSALARSENTLREGKNLLVFAEGTRARSGRLQPFNRIAFQLAIGQKLPVIPVLVHSILPFMARVPGSAFPDGLNTFRICFLDPESPRADDTADSLRERMHRRMAAELKKLDAGTCWEIRTA